MISRVVPLLLTLTPTLLAQDGHQLFTLCCSACHGVDGKGATGGTFPPLAESPWLAGDADRAVKIALKGLTGPVEVLGKIYNLEMPPQGAALPDEQIAAILTYVRSAWGNQASAVTPEFVKTIRASVDDRKIPWTAAEILKLHPLPFEKTALTNLLSQTYLTKDKTLPDFSKLKAENVEEEHNGILSVKDSPYQDHFGMVWSGSFGAPADGEYQFILDADDAATVSLDGKEVVKVEGIGPMDGTRIKNGKIKLTKGSHTFRTEYLEFEGQQGIALGWKGPDDKAWKWLTDKASKKAKPAHDPIPIEPENGRPVIYRNFITGTTPRSIGVGFPGGLNLAYSADNLAPELLWTGKFIDGAPKWMERGTDNNPPAGENLVTLTKSRFLPGEARFKGYKLDPAGNPTFVIQIGDRVLLDSWQSKTASGLAKDDGTNTLIRRLALNGGGSSAPIDVMITDLPASFGTEIGARPNTSKLEISPKSADYIFQISSESSYEFRDGKRFVKISAGKPVTLTYHWVK